MSVRGLESIFAPKRVAVVGATDRPGSAGRTVLWNLVSNPFGGTVFPVNPARKSVMGIPAYADVASVPGEIDLAVVVTPAESVPGVIAQCAGRGIPGAIIISAGFREVGAHGVELERAILAEAQRGGMRIIGPNCLGVMRTVSGLNATFAAQMARAGSVGFVSQSGALCSAILDWSLSEGVGFSTFVSIGSMLDVGWGDIISYLGDDPHTNSIVIYMESAGDAAAFLSAARAVALEKPIIVIRAGRTEQAAQAAASHTGALTGSDDVLDCALRRCGVLRVDTIHDLFAMAEVLSMQPRAAGPRLAVVTNAGGPGILAADALIGGGGELAALSTETLHALDELLPAQWSHRNPVDVLGDCSPEHYAKAVEVVTKDPNIDGLLAIFAPQGISDATETAKQLTHFAHLAGKPVLASWMGGASVAKGAETLKLVGIPTFAYADTAARMFNHLWRYDCNLQALYETPTLPTVSGLRAPGHTAAGTLIAQAHTAGRTLLSELESEHVLAWYGIPVLASKRATDADQAVEFAERLDYPVVLKLHSEQITHKTDVGGVHLNVNSAAEVREAFGTIERAVRGRFGSAAFGGVIVQPMIEREDGFELILGSSIDPQFGPVLLFGTGGRLVEVLRDRALGLPPLSTTLARRMMERTQIFDALQGVHGHAGVDIAALEQLLVRFSHLVAEQHWIEEIDVNPLFVSEERLVALDARVILHDPRLSEAELPRLAIRVYPSEYVGEWRTRDGEHLIIRPIRAEDEPMMEQFHRTLSDDSVFFRYAHLIRLSERVTHRRLSRLCFIDYAQEMALVAEREDPIAGERTIVGVGRLLRFGSGKGSEFAIVVSDRFQRRGLGTELLRRLVDVGRRERWCPVIGYIMPENAAMQHASKSLGFELRHSHELEMVIARIEG